MGTKKKYNVLINSCSRNYEQFSISIRNTEDILIKVARNSAIIEIDYNPQSISIIENISKKTILGEAIKKTALLHLMKYSKPLVIKAINILDGETIVDYTSFAGQETCLYCIVDNAFHKTLPDKWKERAFLEKALLLSSSINNRLVAALYSFLSAKSAKYEYQRFVFLWTSINGLYDYYYLGQKRLSERDRIRNYIERNGLGRGFPPKDKDKAIAEAVVPILLRIINDNMSGYFLLEEKKQIVEKQIDTILNDNRIILSAYGYLVFGLPYYYRCQLIHGDRPLPLFSFGIEPEIKIIGFINKMLESFLEEHLPLEIENSSTSF